MGALMAFRVGQEVVCVDDELALDLGLKKGNFYTIASFHPAPPHSRDQSDRVKLVETGPIQQWWQCRFRPIVKTDISIFEAMLAPSPKQRVDA